MCRLLKPMAFKEQSPLTPGETSSRSRYCRVCSKLQSTLNSSLPNRNKACGCCLKYSNLDNRTSRAASNAGAELFFFRKLYKPQLETKSRVRLLFFSSCHFSNIEFIECAIRREWVSSHFYIVWFPPLEPSICHFDMIAGH